MNTCYQFTLTFFIPWVFSGSVSFDLCRFVFHHCVTPCSKNRLTHTENSHWWRDCNLESRRELDACSAFSSLHVSVAFTDCLCKTWCVLQHLEDPPLCLFNMTVSALLISIILSFFLIYILSCFLTRVAWNYKDSFLTVAFLPYLVPVSGRQLSRLLVNFLISGHSVSVHLEGRDYIVQILGPIGKHWKVPEPQRSRTTSEALRCSPLGVSVAL